MTYPIAYQLYSSRNFPPLEAQFPALKKMGYDAIEPWLPAYEKDAKGFRKALDDNGLKCFGFHMPFDGLVNEPNRFIDIALTLGATWMIPPYIPPEQRVAKRYLAQILIPWTNVRAIAAFPEREKAEPELESEEVRPIGAYL